MRRYIDINCDMGESFGRFKIGNDEAVFPFISSSNIACGWHGGDPLVIEETIRLAISYGVRIGAHPSYPDRQGFGRRYMQMPGKELRAAVKFQVATLKGLVEAAGGKLSYVKPHGALYNRIAGHREDAAHVYSAVADIDSTLSVMGLAGSHAAEVAHGLGVDFISEAFADRTYSEDGSLTPRTEHNSVIEDPVKAAEQVLGLVLNGEITTTSGKVIHVKADSICIHGDNPCAIQILQAIEAALKANNFSKAGQFQDEY